MELQKDKFIMITTDDFVEMIKDEERVAIIRRMLEAGEIMTEAKLRAVLGVEAPAEKADDSERPLDLITR